MSSWKIIKGINFRQLKSLIFMLFKHPIFMISTVRVTFRVMRISEEEFPGIHGKHNKANAFRHALWNILIAKECARFSKKVEPVLRWTKDFTDWHEDFAPNEELPRFMDLHNNRVGREMYKKMSVKSQLEFITFVKEKLNEAVQITSIDAIEKDSMQLVYIEN